MSYNWQTSFLAQVYLDPNPLPPSYIIYSNSTFLLLSLIKRNFNPHPWRPHNLNLVKLFTCIIPRSNPLVPLQNSRHHIRHLSNSKILSNTNPRSAIKRYILPRFGLPVLPALGRENVNGLEERGGRGVEIGAALHSDCAVKYCVAFYAGYVGETWGEGGQGCVCKGVADVELLMISHFLGIVCENKENLPVQQDTNAESRSKYC
jgi:hypothetical protein